MTTERNAEGFPVDSDGLDFFDHRYSRFGRARIAAERQAELDRLAAAEEARRCEGGTCQDILRQCSKHSMQYQRQFGRAANE